jgi:hypothetical protein
MDTPQQLLDSSSYKQSPDSWAVVGDGDYMVFRTYEGK